jgi:hypothetical protein
MALEPFDFSAHLPTYTPPINLAWEAAKMGFANEMHDRLLEQIADFEKSLKPDEEIGAYLAAFGQGVEIQIQRVGFRNPYLIVFEGTETVKGGDVRLVQHVSQVNVLFTALKVKDLTKPARRIGFVPEEEGEEKKPEE